MTQKRDPQSDITSTWTG